MHLSVIHHLVLATVAFTIILITGVLILSHIAVISGIEKIEKEAAPHTAEKILAVLSLESESLARIAYDWGVWDDTYAFMENQSVQYIESNLASVSLTGIRINDILFFDPEGNLWYKVSVDFRNGSMSPSNQRFKHIFPSFFETWHNMNLSNQIRVGWMGSSIRETSDELISYVQKNKIVGSVVSAQTGIIPLQSGPVLIATHSILMSDEGGPARGTILISRDLDDAKIAELSGYTLYPFRLERNDHWNQSLDHTKEQDSFLSVLNMNDTHISTSSRINDISGNPSYLALMKIPYTNELLWQMILLVSILLTLFFVIILLYYRYYLTRHISNLSVMLDKAVQTGSMPEVLSSRAPSEIICLAESAERVTMSLIQNQHDLHRSIKELDEAEDRWQIL